MIVGIDLGTTFSVGAWIDQNGTPHIANSRDGGNTTPSVVMFDDGEIVIGRQAKDNAVMDPGNVVQFVKRSMGDENFSFLTEDEKEYSAEEISAMILKRIKEDCETCLGENVIDAVITVPAYFGDAQRQATMNAGRIAGLNVRAIINEPTAAAYAYGFTNNNKLQRVMIYDLGGGTFDVTVIEIKPNHEIQVLATHGNRNLGGVNFDNLLIKYVRDIFEKETGLDLDEDDEAIQILRTKCEQAKISLSGSTHTTVVMSVKGKKMKIDISRERFDQLIQSLIDETEIDIDIALEDSGLTVRDIDKVLLVGGSSRIPAVRDFVQRKMNIVPSAELNPDEVVAIGAAYYGHSLEHPVPGPTPHPPIKDVNSHGLGVVADDENNNPKNYIIIPRNQPIPTIAQQSFSTVSDNQEIIELKVTEGDDEDLSYVTVIGTAEIHIPPHPAFSPITIELSYDSNGIIVGKVFDDTINNYVGDIIINRSNDMSQQEIDESTEKIDSERFT